MNDRASLWGPKIDPYSFNFDPSETKDLETAHAYLYAVHSAYHPARIQRDLLSFDLGVGDLEKTIRFDHMSVNLRRYMDTTGEAKTQDNSFRVFRNYYGFLCVRYLIHLTCVTILRETNTMGNLAGYLHSQTNWNQVSKAVALVALSQASRATTTAALWKRFSAIFTRASFVEDMMAGSFSAILVIQMLWSDRGSLLSLYMRGLLPGCSLLILASLKLLAEGGDMPGIAGSYPWLLELGYRLYLLGSRQDRQISRLVCVTAIEKKGFLGTETSRFIDPKDSRMILSAYSDLLLVWRRDAFRTKDIPIEFVSHMATFAMGYSAFDPSATDEERIGTARTALQFLWLLFEHRGQIPMPDHSKIRDNSIASFSFVARVQSEISTKANHYQLSQMLADVEFVALVGRVLLLITEANEVSSTDHSFRKLPEILHDLQYTIDESTSIAPELFHESGIEWAKVLVQFSIWMVMGTMDLEKNADVLSHMHWELATSDGHQPYCMPVGD
ncbi:hypothetical protein FS749_002490 [Ceratobasidium sp. UAMH 11750]|nr:hypothetical protein FS749_002490 [Ceratobasidium sp. UAMH 11750]